MKSWMMIAVAMLPVAAHAQWEPVPEVLRVEAKGEGPWTVTCQLLDKKGQPVTREIRGRGKRQERLTLMEATGGQCSYQAASDKPLTLAVKGGLYACTLPAPTNMKRRGCEQTMPAGASGQFEIRRRS